MEVQQEKVKDGTMIRITGTKKNMIDKMQQSKNVLTVDSYRDGAPRRKIF